MIRSLPVIERTVRPGRKYRCQSKAGIQVSQDLLRVSHPTTCLVFPIIARCCSGRSVIGNLYIRNIAAPLWSSIETQYTIFLSSHSFLI